jgi:hypothetical protein
MVKCGSTPNAIASEDEREQVIKKWLSYRESRVLGRHLRREEVREVQNIARRITALLLLEPELDANYQAVKANVYPWPQKDEATQQTWEV